MQKLKSVLQVLTLSTAIVGLSACAHLSQDPNQSPTLTNIQSMTSKSTSFKSTKQNSIRLKALHDTALSYAAQQALAQRSKQINGELTSQAMRLDHVFDFNALLLDHNVVPPILAEGRFDLSLDNAKSLRISDQAYKILAQAHFTTVAPSWRDYVWMNFDTPEKPDATLLPKNKKEQQYWQQYTDIGWQKGLEQANTIFDTNLGRLKQSYEGMVLYHELLAKHMVSKPFVAKTDLGITGGGDQVRINDQILRITALPGLDVNTQHWKTALVK